MYNIRYISVYQKYIILKNIIFIIYSYFYCKYVIIGCPIITECPFTDSVEYSKIKSFIWKCRGYNNS